MKLFSESVNKEIEYITEETDGGAKSYKIRGIFMQADVKNRNGRVYPYDILAKEVTKYNKNFIKENRAFGELGHPDGPTVNLERVSHMITDLHPDGKDFIGEAKIMDTPMGKIVKNLMDEGAKLGVSSRGMGSLDEKGGTNYVRDDFYLATAADIVADPSAPNAFVEGIMEGREWIWDNGLLREQDIERAKNNILKATSKKLEEVKINEFKNLLSKL
jgi:hypothetical protein